ncbi:hypothetical protein [Streptomyces sp. H27-S2]|uniref:hypothetical protein n=1 Tax=Streptomyces antarcticus TaxID=2996458 RepID=UPI003B635802
MTSEIITASSAGTWQLGDLRVNRLGFGAMRLAQTGEGFAEGAAARDRDRDRGRATAVLRRAVELGVNHVDTAPFWLDHATPRQLRAVAVAVRGRGTVPVRGTPPVRSRSGPDGGAAGSAAPTGSCGRAPC